MAGHTNEVQQIANEGWDERILVCRNGSLVDAFIVITERYVILVDTLINPHTAEIMFSMTRGYLENQRQLLVVNTHADYDHCWETKSLGGRMPPTLRQSLPA